MMRSRFGVDNSIAEELDLFLRHRDCDYIPLPGRDVTEVVVVPHQYRVRDGVADWWPRASLKDKRLQLNERGAYAGGGYVSHRKGLMQTAAFVVGAESDEEALSALFMAFLTEVRNGRIPEWRGEPRRLIGDVMAEMRGRCSFEWHHAMRNLFPIPIPDVFAPPTSVRRLVDAFRVMAAACHADYQIVRIVNGVDPSPHDTIPPEVA